MTIDDLVKRLRTYNRDFRVQVISEAADRIEELGDLKWVLESHGWRRCDIPACNCGSWHPPKGIMELQEQLDNANDRIEELKQRLRDVVAWLTGEWMTLHIGRNKVKELMNRAGYTRCERCGGSEMLEVMEPGTFAKHTEDCDNPDCINGWVPI
jgi:hypothetical protein